MFMSHTVALKHMLFLIIMTNMNTGVCFTVKSGLEFFGDMPAVPLIHNMWRGITTAQ